MGKRLIKYEDRVVLLSLSVAVFAWVVDAIADSLVFGEGTFLDSLLLRTTPQEIYYRLFLVLCFFAFGIAMSGTLARRRSAEDDLQKAVTRIEDEKAKFQAIIAAIPDGISILDRNFRVLYQNDVHRALVGDQIGKACFEVYSSLETICEGCPVARAFEDGKLHVLEKSRHSEQGLLHIEINAAPLRNAQGDIIAGIEAVRDITARKRTEAELERHRERLAELVDERTAELQREMAERRRMEDELVRAQKLESLGVLAGGIAHDFNNLLGAIMGNLSLALMDCEPSNPGHRQLVNAERASLRAQELTQQLLTFSKGGAPLKRITSLPAVIRETAGFALRGSQVKHELTHPPDLWTVDADEGQIAQVFHNLLINADHAMPSGGVIQIAAGNAVVRDGEVPGLAAGRYVRIAVRDHGTGISPEHLPKIFDPYFTTKQKGSGLGLAATYSIIRKHDGHIAVESVLGKGTTFHLYLPAMAGATAEPAQDSLVLTGTGRVLVMDDEEEMRRTTGDMLTRLGYTVSFAEEGLQAVTRYQKSKQAGCPYDLVIMDLTIPGGMGGKEAVRRLLEIDPAAKVIVSSGYSQDPVMADYKTYGFMGVVTKPYRIRELSEVVAAVLAGGREEGRCSSVT